MGSDRSLTLIDSDLHRRAAICHALEGSGIHVEPFEDIGELTSSWPRAGVILAEDYSNTIAALLDRMTEKGGWLPVIAFCERPSTHDVVRALQQGAIDYLQWPSAVAEVADAVAAAEAGGAALVGPKFGRARARRRLQRLTRREREVLDGVTLGLSNRLIGERLAISPRTVEIHRANMLNKMGANHTSEAIRIAIEASLGG